LSLLSQQRLGGMADIKISLTYHRLRVLELELTADYLAKKQEEREAEREHKARLREERIALKEYQEAFERLAKEHRHYQNAIEALRAKGDLADLAELEAKLAEIEQALRGVEERQANIRTGYVYVISNVGSFGEGVVKIGMSGMPPGGRAAPCGATSNCYATATPTSQALPEAREGPGQVLSRLRESNP
jgi:hypothetical protein